ncbi:uncharacterized protein LOC133183363 [Saccostrea echinata]|uniref:uncharacterized protein LOC133183363 n=1 Tax=Saccostrea echinata TaxID=191078 RepID=UPI002A81C369|nr:uncharacterized protein LOC133183363 [Saccostrea echinata]
MRKHSFGFTNHQVNSVGNHVVSTLTQTFWYLDPHHEKFQKRGLQLPKLFKDLSGYRDLKVQHKKIPQVTSIDLKENAQNLSSLLTIPWMMNPQFKELYTSIEDLISHLKKYEEYLCDCNKKMKANHESTVPIRDLKDNWILRVIESVENVPVEYKALDLCVKDLAEYQPIDLIRFEPNDKEERRKWIKHLSLSSSVALYSFQYGNYLGNMNVLWKLPESTCRDTVKQVKVIDKIKRNILKFSTRKMQKDFIDRYKSCTGLQPVILRNMVLLSHRV